MFLSVGCVTFWATVRERLCSVIGIAPGGAGGCGYWLFGVVGVSVGCAVVIVDFVAAAGNPLVLLLFFAAWTTTSAATSLLLAAAWARTRLVEDDRAFLDRLMVSHEHSKIYCRCYGIVFGLVRLFVLMFCGRLLGLIAGSRQATWSHFQRVVRDDTVLFLWTVSRQERTMQQCLT